MAKSAGRPYTDSRLVKFLDKRILELRPRKSQAEIATEAGFRAVNMMAMVKTGRSKLPLDRVPALAEALECDFVYLFMLAVEQTDVLLVRMINENLRLVTKNEMQIVELVRGASRQSDPHLTRKLEKAIREVFA